MKLNLTGPQALTLFPTNKLELIPVSAKSSSYASPQAYYCNADGVLKLYLKGQEYTFHDAAMIPSPTAEACDTVNAEEHRALAERVETLEEKMFCVYDKMYMPMRTAFEDAHKEHGK